MKLWIAPTEAEDGSLTVKRAYGSEKEARAGVGKDENVNGEALFFDVNSDKAGIIALFNGDYTINETEKAFDIKKGRWSAR